MTKTLLATYEGSGGVRIDGHLYAFPNKDKGDGYGGVMPKAARKLLKAGHDPKTLVHVTRNGTSVFSKDTTLQAWAALVYEEPEDAKHGVRRRRYRPLDPTKLKTGEDARAD